MLQSIVQIRNLPQQDTVKIGALWNSHQFSMSDMAFMSVPIMPTLLIGRNCIPSLSQFHSSFGSLSTAHFCAPVLHPHRQLRFPTSCSPCMSTASTSAATAPQLYVSLPSDPVVGFIGLGVMGLPMLNNLTKTFNKFVVWNRTPKDLSSLSFSKIDVELATDPANVVNSADITFSMLSTPEAVHSVFYDCDNPALSAVTAGKVIVNCSTLQISDMTKAYSHITQKGGAFLEAPVSGSKGPAEQGQLIFLCAGDRPVFEDPVIKAALQAMGKRAFYLGEVGNATKMKLVINQLMATMLAALGESIVLTEAVGLSVPDLLEVISFGAMNNPMFSLKGPKMQHEVKGYETTFAMEHARKDVCFAQALCSDHGVNMSVSSAANEWYNASKGLGLDEDDFCAVIECIRAAAGRQ